MYWFVILLSLELESGAFGSKTEEKVFDGGPELKPTEREPRMGKAPNQAVTSSGQAGEIR